mmetsp:Transcript_46953/g.102103  ORF Transcript_46953/g.102103 Transcript_46953/m.102103 type:complete len:277 (+) Transcript_46953:680-1510(+)
MGKFRLEEGHLCEVSQDQREKSVRRLSVPRLLIRSTTTPAETEDESTTVAEAAEPQEQLLQRHSPDTEHRANSTYCGSVWHRRLSGTSTFAFPRCIGCPDASTEILCIRKADIHAIRVSRQLLQRLDTHQVPNLHLQVVVGEKHRETASLRAKRHPNALGTWLFLKQAASKAARCATQIQERTYSAESLWVRIQDLRQNLVCLPEVHLRGMKLIVALDGRYGSRSALSNAIPARAPFARRPVPVVVAVPGAGAIPAGAPAIAAGPGNTADGSFLHP